MNPYASYLGNRDAFEVISATAAELRKLLAAIGPEGADKAPAPGKWSFREILCHLADCEIVFAYRIRQTLAEDHHVIQPFDQEKWASTYRAYSASEAMAVFSVTRDWNCALVKNVAPGAYSKKVLHPERGEMDFRVLIETMAGHDLNHLRQVEAICAKAASR